ncbi:sensor histidine kinase [Micromonospora citrea]|uniref:sensor histidine kinase n=1 Tax=Micromonospora citrea TaxID=47855 RepID=UPI001FE1065D|nr:histidine kinase [Micromonospora citrea]
MTDAATTTHPRPWLSRLLRPSGPLPRPSRRSLVLDAVLALGLALVAIQAGYGVPFPAPAGDFAVPHRPDPPQPPVSSGPAETVETLAPALAQHHLVWAVVMLLIAAPLAVRRRYPLAALWIVIGTAAAVAAVTDDRATLRFSFYACVLAAYSAAVYSPYRLPALASQAAAALLYSKLQSSSTLPTVSTDAVPFLVLIPIAIATDGLRRWRRRAEEERARAAALRRERQEALRRAAEQERARIARELHDVVTHNVSMMVIQAGAARRVMAADQEQAREALLAVEAGGRAAMSELRHVMGLLTMGTDGSDPAGAADLAPQPGLDRLDALVAGVRASGVPVQLRVAGQPRPVPSGIQLAAYRVVQEALTNTVRHAPGASASVVVDYQSAHLGVEVVDTGGAEQAPAATGSGRGLVGLRERLAVYGGILHAGPLATGGYRVHVRIPLEAW